MGSNPTNTGLSLGCAIGGGRSAPGVPPARRRRGFSLLELLIVLGVATTLLALLFPSLDKVRESARRVYCGRNMYQIGTALATYADDHDWYYPGSYYVGYGNHNAEPQHMMALHSGRHRESWDGLGLLLPKRYISDPEAYYCPSHKGNHPYDRYAPLIQNPDGESTIFGNYHYRGLLPKGRPDQPRDISRTEITKLANRFPDGLALVSDGLRTRADFNHVVGSNRLQDDLSVTWYDDSQRRIYSLLSRNPDDDGTSEGNGVIWRMLD